jgi:hypothetical protein
MATRADLAMLAEVAARQMFGKGAAGLKTACL